MILEDGGKPESMEKIPMNMRTQERLTQTNPQAQDQTGEPIAVRLQQHTVPP